MAKSYEEMLDEAREETEQTDPDAVHDALESGEDITILDVRKPEEWEEGHIKGVKHLPRGLLELKAADELPDTDARSSRTAPAGAGYAGGQDPGGNGLHQRRQHGGRRESLAREGLRDRVDPKPGSFAFETSGRAAIRGVLTEG